MIERYTLQRMADVWTDHNRLQKWLDIEILICEAYGELSEIPPEDLKTIKEKADFDIDRVNEIEKRTRHDVVAFIESVAEFVGPSSKYVHMGVTSSDILDTSFACLLKEASDILRRYVEKAGRFLYALPESRGKGILGHILHTTFS